MGVKYIGGVRSHIQFRQKRKNANRWLYVPGQKEKLRFDATYWLCVVSVAVAAIALLEVVWFITG